MNNKYVFKTSAEDLEYQPKKEVRTFYQVCQMKNPKTGKYTIRKVIFDEAGNIMKVFEKEYSFDRTQKFMQNNRENKYKMFPVYDISLIALPGASCVLEERSELLNNKHTDYDFAKFV